MPDRGFNPERVSVLSRRTGSSSRRGTARFIRLAALLLSLLPGTLHAAGLSLTWEPSPDPAVAGYVIYFGPSGAAAPQRQDVGNTTTTVVGNLQPGLTYSLYLTAYDSATIESDPSNVIEYTVPSATNSIPVQLVLAVQAAAGGPIRLLVTGPPGLLCEVLASADMLDWSVVDEVTISEDGTLEWIDPESSAFRTRFYRLREPGP
jgi:hypothetical protein